MAVPEQLAPSGPFPGGGTLFASAPDLWEESVGRPLGLEPYGVTAKALDRALRQFAKFREKHADGFEVWGSGGTDAAQSIAAADLCRLLGAYGPMGAVAGVVELPFVSVSSWADRGCVSLREYHQEVWDLGLVWDEVERGYLPLFNQDGERISSAAQWSSLLQWLENRAALALREFEVTPQWLSAGKRMRLTPGPLTLRAVMWLYLFDQIGESGVRRCKLCKEKFRLPKTRGRPPVMCEKHREGKFHQTVRDGRAP